MQFDAKLELWRIKTQLFKSSPGDSFGAFYIPGPCGRDLFVRATNDNDWEHVSVSIKTRCPNWEEMNFIKDLFWHENEAVMQLHPPKSEYVNMHKFCLHMWRPLKAIIPLPPSILVGIKDMEGF
jgi:hypothetical protein